MQAHTTEAGTDASRARGACRYADLRAWRLPAGDRDRLHRTVPARRGLRDLRARAGTALILENVRERDAGRRGTRTSATKELRRLRAGRAADAANARAVARRRTPARCRERSSRPYLPDEPARPRGAAVRTATRRRSVPSGGGLALVHGALRP